MKLSVLIYNVESKAVSVTGLPYIRRELESDAYMFVSNNILLSNIGLVQIILRTPQPEKSNDVIQNSVSYPKLSLLSPCSDSSDVQPLQSWISECSLGM